jgi:hypothetical protein
MGIFKLKLFLFCPLLLVRQRSFTFAAYQQRLLLVEAGHTNEGAGLINLYHSSVKGTTIWPNLGLSSMYKYNDLKTTTFKDFKSR